MRRRDVLRVAGGGLATIAGGGVATARRNEYGPLGRVGLRGAKEAVVGPDGTTVYVAVTDGFAVVDVSDPRSPSAVYENRSVLADRQGGPLRGIADVKVDGDRLAVVGPAHPPGDDAIMAAVVYDVSDPAAPKRETVYETDYFLHNCFLRDGRLYLPENYTSTNRLVIVDVATGERLGRWSVTQVNETWSEVPMGNWVLHDLWVHGERAYLAHWDAGTYVVDVSDPADVSLVSKVRGRPPETFVEMSAEEARREGMEPPGNDHFVTVDEDASLLGISVESWDAGEPDDTGGPGAVHLFDVSDPTKPEKLSRVPPPPSEDESFHGVWTTSHNFDIAGGRLYTSWYQGGVKVHDVSDPANPKRLAKWRDSSAASFWTAQLAETCFVGSSRKDPSQVDGAPADGPGAAIYTFPTDATGSFSTAPETPSDSPTDSPTATPTSTPTGTSTATPTGTPTGDSGPGFGPLAAVAAIGYGAWRAVRDGE